MKYEDIIIVKRRVAILKEYEKTKAKVTSRPFKFVKDICEAHHINKKDLSRYYLTNNAGRSRSFLNGSNNI